MRRILYFTLAMCFWAAPTFADTTCAAANFSSIIFTTCDIGPLQFQFTGFFAAYNVTDIKTGQVFDQMTWTPSNFYFTPTSDGFTVTFLNGPQLILSSLGYHAGEDIFLFYNLTIQDPALLVTSEIVSSPGLAVSGSDSSDALVGGSTSGTYVGGVCGGTRVLDRFGTITTIPFEPCAPVRPLLPDLSNTGTTFMVLDADNGNTVFWSGATNYTFTTGPVPEPGPLTLLGSGLLGVACIVLFKRVLLSH
jgi:PEP-CTERM motif